MCSCPLENLLKKWRWLNTFSARKAWPTWVAADQRLARVGLALISGGAAGNLIDRIAGGSVVDFVDAYWRSWHFWTFNVADSAITVGVTVMLFDMLLTGSHGTTEHAD